MPAVVNVLVRRPTEADLEAVQYVGHRTWPTTYEPIAGADFVAMGLAKWWSAESIRPLDHAAAGSRSPRSTGWSWASPPRDRMTAALVVWKLYVLPEHQGRGIGARLLERGRRGCSGLYPEIRAAYIEGNVSARGFYAHKGFVEADREPGSGGLPDTIWMSRPVAAG